MPLLLLDLVSQGELTLLPHVVDLLCSRPDRRGSSGSLACKGRSRRRRRCRSHLRRPMSRNGAASSNSGWSPPRCGWTAYDGRRAYAAGPSARCSAAPLIMRDGAAPRTRRRGRPRPLQRRPRRQTPPRLNRFGGGSLSMSADVPCGRRAGLAATFASPPSGEEMRSGDASRRSHLRPRPPVTSRATSWRFLPQAAADEFEAFCDANAANRLPLLERGSRRAIRCSAAAARLRRPDSTCHAIAIWRDGAARGSGARHV